MPEPGRIESVFLNIPYDTPFETLYTAYVVGLTQLGLDVTATLGFPNQDRLEMIFQLIEEASVSIHDLSRIEASHGTPRFNMPLELGIALHWARVSKGKQNEPATVTNPREHAKSPTPTCYTGYRDQPPARARNTKATIKVAFSCS